MWLTGNKIRESVLNGKISIIPYHDSNINPNSYNYTLYPVIKRIINKTIDLKKEDNYEEIKIDPKKGYLLLPGECYLGCTNEIFGSNKFASLVTGRSSIGRKFVTNHITAGLIDQGFFGRITLEIIVSKPTIIYPHIPFGQIFWFKTVGDPLLYKGRYQNQFLPEVSKIYQNLVSSTKMKKAYLVFSEKKNDFFFENDFYLNKKVDYDLELKYDSILKNKIKSLIKNDNIDRIELTGGQDPLLNKDITLIIKFLTKLNLKIKLYTKGNNLLKIPMVDEINIVFNIENGSIEELKKSLLFYKRFSKKIRISVPLTKRFKSKRKLNKFVSKIEKYCDEIVFRPLTKKYKRYKKEKPNKISLINKTGVKYDKIEFDRSNDDSIILLPSFFNKNRI